jgi:hypothetical protein
MFFAADFMAHSFANQVKRRHPISGELDLPVIASEAKQSMAREQRTRMDCFVADALRNDEIETTA